MPDLENVLRGLTKAQRRVVTETDGVRQRSEVNQRTWAVLFRECIASNIIAGGYLFFDLTDFGDLVRTRPLSSCGEG